jgi:hypothetical protein
MKYKTDFKDWEAGNPNGTESTIPSLSPKIPSEDSNKFTREGNVK